MKHYFLFPLLLAGTGLFALDMNRPQQKLAIAIEQGSPEEIQKAIDNGANVDDFIVGEIRPISFALTQKHENVLPIVQKLIDNNCRLTFSDSDPNRPVFTAVESGKTEILQLILESGGNPNEKSRITGTDTPVGLPALFIASFINPKIVSLLHRYGGDMNIQDPWEQNVFHHIARTPGANPSTIYLLAQYGAKINTTDKMKNLPTTILLKTLEKIPPNRIAKGLKGLLGKKLEAFINIGAQFSVFNPEKIPSEARKKIMLGACMQVLVNDYIAQNKADRSGSLFLWVCKINPLFATLPIELKKYMFQLIRSSIFASTKYGYPQGQMFAGSPEYIEHMKSKTPILAVKNSKNPDEDRRAMEEQMLNVANSFVDTTHLYYPDVPLHERRFDEMYHYGDSQPEKRKEAISEFIDSVLNEEK